MCGPWAITLTAAPTGRWRCTGTAAAGATRRFPAPGCCARSGRPDPATSGRPAPTTTRASAARRTGPSARPLPTSTATAGRIFSSRHWHPANLWLNNQNGTFSAADTAFFSSITDRHDCQAADVNQDGLPDLFCSVGPDRGTGVKSNALYIQQPGGTFADQAYQWNVADPASRGRYGTVLDANHDGYPDVFYGAESLRPDGLPSINRFYLNTGQGSFIDSPAMGLDLNIGSLCAHTVDYNSDGWPDLLVCGEAGACTCSETTKATASPMCPRSSAPR